MNQEKIQQAQESYQALQQAEQQLNFILNQEHELENLNAQLTTLNVSPTATLLTSLGKGVFIETQKNPPGAYFVDVGAGFFMKKTAVKIQATITTQLSSLKNMEHHTQRTIEIQQQSLRTLFEQLQK